MWQLSRVFMMVLVAASLAACAQMGRQSESESGATSGGDQAQQEVPKEAKDFLRTSAASHQFEIQASQYVRDNSKNQEVKDFADRMIRDHQMMLNNSKRVAEENQVSVSDKLTPDLQAQLDDLRNSSRDQLDQNYARIMESSHQQTIDRLRAHIQQSDFTPTTDLAQSTLDRVNRHHSMAQQLSAGLQQSSDRMPASEQ